jgi:hypothetical protein
MTMRIRVAGLLLLGMSCLPWHVSGQETPRGVQAPAGGWIGISVEFTSLGEGGEVRTAAVITQVVPGSPAQAAGIQVGDTLLSFDGQTVSEGSLLALPGTLRAGDLVRFTVRRGGQARDLLVEATPRPSSFPAMAPNLRAMVVRLDTLRGAILQNLDSLMLSIAGLEGATLHVDSTLGGLNIQLRQVPFRGDPSAGPAGIHLPPSSSRDSTGARVRAVWPDYRAVWPNYPAVWPDFFFPSPDPAAFPFASFAVRTPATDSLRSEINQTRQEVTALRREQIVRQRELQEALGRASEESLRRDERMEQLRAREELLLARQERLSAQLARLSEEEIQSQWAKAQSRYEQSLSRMMESQREAQERLDRRRQDETATRAEVHAYSRAGGGSPVIVGQSVMLGAHLAPMNPDLASVFSVPEGVFVIQVPEGTPAADAGLVGGDIIVRIGDEKVVSLADLRFGLASRKTPIRIEVIRRGRPVEVVVRR